MKKKKSSTGKLACLTALCSLIVLLGNLTTKAQVSSNVTISPQVTPASLTPCSGRDSFVVRVSNISAAPIANLTFRDSMPPGINYVAGSVSGTGVTMGTTILPNVVTFNISNIPSSGFVDVTFKTAVNCSVSSNANSISNTYKVSWGTFFTAPYVTATYPVSFPSLSVTVDSPSVSRVCGTPFVRRITICNGGIGVIDSITLKDSEANTNLTVVGFDRGTVTGANTNNATTVLKAADFATVGNMDGKLDQGECIIVTDTLKAIGVAASVTGTITATWGCYATNCTNPSSNTFSVSTVITTPVSAALTRISFVQTSNDSSGHIFNHTTTYREVITNSSATTAVGANVVYLNHGIKYIDTTTIRISKNGSLPYAPPYALAGGNTPASPGIAMSNVVAPVTYTGSTGMSNVRVTLGDINPGDTLVITFSTLTTGPVTRVSDAYFYNNNGNFYYCTTGGYYNFRDGPSISTAVEGRLNWNGGPCAPTAVAICKSVPAAAMFNGTNAGPEPDAETPLFLARFRNFSFTDSSAIQSNSGTCKIYYDQDTVKLLMISNVDIPFYTDKSKLVIKIYTNGGAKWDGNLGKVYARLGSWTNVNWLAAQVVDNTASDSTILVYFKRNNCPATALTNFANDVYKSYRGGDFRLNMQFVNTCPGGALKQLRMTRIYTIDTTASDPAIEAGPVSTFPFSWNSYCPSACADGLQIQSYGQTRTTMGRPDNNNDGIADTTGTFDMSRVKSNLITWGDTLQLKYKMVVRTTQAGGVPYMYVRTTLKNTTSDTALNTANGIIANGFLKKTAPKVKVTRPGLGSFTATAGTVPIDNANTSLLNLSLQGAGGITLPGITAYQDGDTIEVTEDVVYWTPHQGWGLTTWNFSHIPYTSTVANPAAAQQFKCDSISCGIFQTIDMSLGQVSNTLTAINCADTLVLRTSIFAQTANPSCGSTFFPAEARDIMTPVTWKMIIPAASNWSVQRINVYWIKKINGTGNCTNTINNQLLPVSQYSFSGDTLVLNLKQIGLFFGQNITVNELRSYFTFDIGLKYTLLPSETGCVKDHMDKSIIFQTRTKFETVRPVDSATLVNWAETTTALDINGAPHPGVDLNWPGANNNTVTFPAGNVVSVTQPNVIVPVTYTRGLTGVSGNDFMAIPDRPGITVDSVKDVVTGLRILPVSGGDIYNVAYLPLTSPVTPRNFNVYTHVSLCGNDTLFIYADRTPCTGMPASWNSYGCKTSASKIGYRYLTFPGELQMQDSLYSTQKDLCTADTIQFNVFNSQTQDAHGIKIHFTLPPGMQLVPGQTQLRSGNGSFVTVTDPVLTAGVYTWTQPAADTLRNVALAPANAMSLRCAVTTSCGYISGSQITSSITGNVACGPITSLINSNPLPLSINSAPALSYFSNVEATVQQVTGCAPTASYDYRIALHVSGGPTLTSDSVKVILPAGYSYVSYNPAAPGSVHAPAGAPSSTALANGATQLTWRTTPGIAGGDSIVFTFKYKEVSGAVNKCAPSPDRNSIVSTSINSIAFCATTGTNCSVGISNGGDTVNMQSLKPDISTTTSTVEYGNAFGSPSPFASSYLRIDGNLINTGSAAVAPGTNIIMEPFMDLDNSGTITPGDYAFDPHVYSGGLAIGASVPYSYTDSLVNAACPTCGNKNVLLRFSNNPSLPLASSQCLCDSVTVTLVMATTIPLDLVLGALESRLATCNQAILTWNTYEETGTSLYFEIQESFDGVAFHTIKMVTAKGSGSNYEQIVNMPSEKAFFRLVMHANDRKTYSKVVAIESNCLTKGTITAWPNPFSNTIYVKGAQKGSEIALFDITGRKLLDRNANGNETDILDMQGLTGGTYVLTVTDVNGKVTRIKLSKD